MTALTDQQTEIMPQPMPQMPLMGHLADAASANMAYGTPIKANGRTIIPVAMVATRLGGGFGRGRVRLSKPPTDGQHPDNQSEKQPGMGGGFGSRLVVRPIGFIDVSDHRSRFTTIAPGRFVALGFALAMAVGGLLGGLMRSRYRAMHQHHA